MTDANSHPQPRTFAPSKEDVLQNLTYFFGQPVSPEKLKDYSEHHAMTYHFPDVRRARARPHLAALGSDVHPLLQTRPTRAQTQKSGIRSTTS